MRRQLTLALALVLVALPAAARPAAPQGRTIPNLGTLDFPNSGSEAAQDAFVRGVLLLHNFEYEDSRTAFLEAQQIDPDFALAYWGEAMTFNHPLWAQQDRDGALEALARLAPDAESRRARAGSEREAMYLDAIEALYGDGDKPSRDAAYMAAMEALQAAHPEDLEARAFYALSVLGSVPARDFRTYMKAASIAEEVFARNPNHPGAAHYMIHSYDDPVHAPLGLRAARSYAEIAPAASHAQHMISHIYTALGHWDEVIEANEMAVLVSEKRLERMGRSLAGRSHHALLWLEYGLLQQGRFDEAREKVAIMHSDVKENPGGRTPYYWAAMRGAYVVADPTREVPAAGDHDRPWGVGVIDMFTDGYRAAATGDLPTARAAIDSLADTIESARMQATSEAAAINGAISADDLTVATTMTLQLDAVVTFLSGDQTTGMHLAQEAADLEDSRPLEYGPPRIIKPAHELLGEMSLRAGRPAEAARHFRKALDRASNRVQSLVGLARAQEATGDMEAAGESWDLLHDIWRGDMGLLHEPPAGWLDMEITAER